jgi:prephenate dehydrogenase
VTVGLIGYGRFGKLAAKYIARHATVFVHDKNKRVRSPSKRIRNATLHQAASQQIVILAVPVSSLKKTLHSIAPSLQHSALVLDVSAVKAIPVGCMQRILPKHVYILGTHPLFGPDSARDSVRGHRIFLCPVRIPDELLRHVIRLLKGEGLYVQEISPREHDKLIAETLFLTQLVGRLVGSASLPRHAHSTNSYSELMNIVRIADNDTRELFHDMWAYNAYAKRIVKRLQRVGKKLLSELR